jgi:hypothetical protein
VSARKPLVLGDDGLQEILQAGDSLAGASLVGSATVTLPDGAGVREWIETITATGVTTSSLIQVSLVAGPDTDENDPEFLVVGSISGAPLTDQIDVNLTFQETTSGPINIQWSAQ